MSNFSILNYLQEFMENLSGGEQLGGETAEEREFNLKILPDINTTPHDGFAKLLNRYFDNASTAPDLLLLTVTKNQEEFRKHQVRIVQKMLEKLSSTATPPQAAAYSGGASFAGGYAGGYEGGMIGGVLTLGDQSGNKKYGPPLLIASSIVPAGAPTGGPTGAPPGPGVTVFEFGTQPAPVPSPKDEREPLLIALINNTPITSELINNTNNAKFKTDANLYFISFTGNKKIKRGLFIGKLNSITVTNKIKRGLIIGLLNSLSL